MSKSNIVADDGSFDFDSVTADQLVVRRRHTINVPMISRSALLLPGDHADGHRGAWFYDPGLYGTIEPGDSVLFVNNGTVLVEAVVRDLLIGYDPDKIKRYCSAMNARGFTWEPLSDHEAFANALLRSLVQTTDANMMRVNEHLMRTCPGYAARLLAEEAKAKQEQP